jgi:signal transduction histidine kinase
MFTSPAAICRDQRAGKSWLGQRGASVGHLASRAAAYKLWQILGLLLLPVAVLWALYFIGAKHNIEILDATIAGLAPNSTEMNALEAQREKAWANLSLFTLIGLSFSFAGVGLAIKLMRSTFTRLDDVEKSNVDVQAAKQEAEELAARLSTINDDITRLNLDLATKVTELKDAQDELISRGRMEQLGQLTATIAHEMRNPLGAIRTSAFLLERQASKHSVDISGHVQRINNGVNRCDMIITQLLDYSRTKEVHSSMGLLDDWLAKTVREEAGRLPENVYVECALGLEGVQVAFDPARLQRAVINLISNAAEALSGQNGTKHPSIWVTTLKQDGHACIRITDNGPGISPENLEKIREPLFTTKSFGTGLGIPAVEQIVAQHKGKLTILSETGAGATFTIHLPLHPQSQQAA